MRPRKQIAHAHRAHCLHYSRTQSDTRDLKDRVTKLEYYIAYETVASGIQ